MKILLHKISNYEAYNILYDVEWRPAFMNDIDLIRLRTLSLELYLSNNIKK